MDNNIFQSFKELQNKITNRHDESIGDGIEEVLKAGLKAKVIEQGKILQQEINKGLEKSKNDIQEAINALPAGDATIFGIAQWVHDNKKDAKDWGDEDDIDVVDEDVRQHIINILVCK